MSSDHDTVREFRLSVIVKLNFNLHNCSMACALSLQRPNPGKVIVTRFSQLNAELTIETITGGEGV